jgi:rubrerythrin
MPAPMTNENANAWVTEAQSCRQQDEGEDVMLSLAGSRTDENLKRAVLDEARFDRRYLRHELAAEAAGHRDLAAMLRAAAKSGAAYASGHLDFLVAGDKLASMTPTVRSADELAATIAAMTEEHIAMYAGMARTAHEEGFEDVAGWFETLAKAVRSQARRMRGIARQTT